MDSFAFAFSPAFKSRLSSSKRLSRQAKTNVNCCVETIVIESTNSSVASCIGCTWSSIDVVDIRRLLKAWKDTIHQRKLVRVQQSEKTCHHKPLKNNYVELLFWEFYLVTEKIHLLIPVQLTSHGFPVVISLDQVRSRNHGCFLFFYHFVQRNFFFFTQESFPKCWLHTAL